jgi:hypothetical protein
MPTDSFPNIDVDVSEQRATFAEAQRGPKWVIDTTLFAGQPTLTAVRTHRHINNLDTTILTLTLANARYPGTQIVADLTVQIEEIDNDLSGEIQSSVTLKLVFANASFGWTSDEFVDWLNGVTTKTAQISPAGVVLVLGRGGINFGPTSATLTLTPGVLTIAAPNVCSFTAFGVVSGGTSLSLAIPGTSPETRTVVQASSPFDVPLPSPTPIGSLTPRLGFAVLTALTTETTATVTFSSAVLTTQYTLDVQGALTDLNGAPVHFDLDAGEVQVNLSATPAQIVFATLGRPSSPLLLTAGIGLSVPQPLDGPGTLRLAMSFDGSAWQVIKAVVPLPGLFLPLDDGIAEPASELGQDFSLVPGGPNWIALGPLSDAAPRVHIEDFRVSVTRPQDLLGLELIGSNMAFEVVDGQAPTLGPGPQKNTSFWRVVFPPQYVAEQAFHEAAEQPSLDKGPNEPLVPPVDARMAGPTQLAFIVPPDLPRFPLTLANLLDWSRYEQAGTALDNPGQPPPLQRPDLDRQTAIEIPYRMLLSVDNASGWSHAVTAPADLSELWNTRLALRKPIGNGHFVIDERVSSGTRQGRVFYSPDLDAPEDPVFTSLNANERQQIARLTSGSSPAAHSFEVKELMLTGLGGTMHVDTNWNPPAGFDVTLWQHTASFGRDQYVRVGKRGFIAPYGHRATQIIVSERRFLAPQGDGAQAIAGLVQFSYIIVTQPVRSYAGLDLPFTQIEFATRVTPILSPPEPFPNTNAFWIQSLGDVPLIFDLAATDLLSRTVAFRAPAIFIGDDADDQSFDNSVDAAVTLFRSDSTINTPVDFKRQKIAFAPSGDPEATSFETAALSLDILDLRTNGGSWRDPQTGEPLFRPTMASASIRHAAAAALAGAPGTVSVSYFPDYVKQADLRTAAANTGVDVFLLIEKEVAAKAKLGADKAGLASPAYALTSISKQFGAVGGDPRNIPQKIVPGDFLDDSAKFLGDIQLSSLIKTDGISQIPNLNTVINKAPDGTPTSAITTFEWHPPLEVPLNEGALSLIFTNTTLDLTVKIITQLTAPPVPPPPPVSDLFGQVSAFQISFAGLVALHFDSMTFHSVTGQKPKIDVKLDKTLPVEFLGDLEFVNALRDLIPSNGFSPSSALPSAALAASDAPAPANGPFLDVTPNLIIAGFSLAVPSVGIGVFSLENIRLRAALTLPLEDSPVSFAFNFGERDHKFLLTVDLLAGGGFLAIELNSQGIQRLEFAIEFGANVALNLFVATGSAHVLAGAHLIYSESDGPSFTAYLRAGGELTVLGLVSISVDFYLAMIYRSDTHDLHGIATLTVEVSVAFISKSVSLTMERSFAGSGGSAAQQRLVAACVPVPLGAPTLEDILSEADWSAYAGAFA